MSVTEKFVSMEWGAAPEDPREVVAWLDGHRGSLGILLVETWREPAEGKYFESEDPSTGDVLASVAQGSGADVDAAVKAARGALRAVAEDWWACAGAIFVCAGAAGAEAFAAAGSAGDDGQREADSREPRPGYSTGGAAFLSSRGVGADSGVGVSGICGVRSCRADYSVEFSAVDAGVEDCAGAGGWEYGGAEAGGVYAADGAGVCGALRRGGVAGRRREHCDRRW